MCRGKNTCSELGVNPEKRDKFSPLRTPNWMTNEIDLFVSAIDDFLSGDKNSCLEKPLRAYHYCHVLFLNS
jgi:hypothetical protein